MVVEISEVVVEVVLVGMTTLIMKETSNSRGPGGFGGSRVDGGQDAVG